MLLTIKLTTFAFDYYDGSLPQEKSSSYQKQMRIEKLPSLLEFYAYVYFFAGFLAGPALNFKEYLNFVDMSVFKTAPGEKMPSAIKPALIKIFHTFIVGAFVQLGIIYPLLYCRTDQFVNHPSFFYKIGYIWMAASLCRFPYYFAWFLSEGSCILCGIGFTSYDKEKGSVWNRATNVKLLDLEFAQNFKGVTEGWNIRTDKWLKHYIYLRVPVAPVPMTFLASAFWHGFYPGYYLSFMSAALVIELARVIRRNIRPWFLKDVEKDIHGPYKSTYDFICVIATSFTLNYIMTPFILLGFNYSINAWLSVYFCGHIAIVIAFVIATFFPKKRKAKAS